MYLRLLKLEFLSFFRNPQFGTSLGIKILTYFGMFYFSVMFGMLSFVLYYFSVEELHTDPIRLFSRYFIYYLAVDLVIRYIMQPMPTQNIKPFLTIGMTKSTLVKYSIVKVFFHFFNWAGLIFLLPFAGILIGTGGFPVWPVLMFVVGITAMFYINNFLNILLNGKDAVFYAIAGLIVGLGALEYFDVVHLSVWSERIFYSFYSQKWVVMVPILIMVLLAYAAYRMLYHLFYLDTGLELKKSEGKTENVKFLERFGTVGVFMNNDIRMIKRTKAARTAFFMSLLFLGYGFMSSIETYQGNFMLMFVGIFVTGGFMFVFGQKVPSWDSSYYPLMMTQNVPYREYLKAKWFLVVTGVVISTIISTFYIFIFDFKFYLTLFAAGIYNLGVNSFLTLVAGAFNKLPVDLNSSRKTVGGGQQKFNLKIMLLMIPQMLLPMTVFTLVQWLWGLYAAVAVIACLGIVGLLLRNQFFNYITKVYKTEKYSTLESFKKTA